MRHYQVVQAIMSALVIVSIMMIVQGTTQATSESQVNATATCRFNSGSQLLVHAQMIVNRIDNIYETTYTRQMIEETVDPDVLAVIKNQVHILVRAQLEETFHNADVTAITKKPSYEKPYFVDEFRVNLTESFFSYNGSMNLPDFINGVLDMGATVSYHSILRAEEGWNITYSFVLLPEMSLSYANSDITNPVANSIDWGVPNWDGKLPSKDAKLSISLKDPTTPVTASEDISLVFTVDTSSVATNVFTNTIVAKKIDLNTYSVFPDFISGLAVVPADGVRLFIDNGLLSWNDVYEHTIQPIEQHATGVLENSTFAQSLMFSFAWDDPSTTNCSTPYNITHMDDAPSIQAIYTDSDVTLQICQIPARAFFGLINAGATANISSEDLNFGRGLEGISYPYTMILRLPTNITLGGKNEYTWNKTTSIGGSFSSTLQPKPAYTEEQVETRIEIDLSKMDLNILSVFTGKTELTASTKMTQDERLYVIHWPTEIPHSPKLLISYLNADAFRLCEEEQVFDEDQINSFLAQKKDDFEQRLSSLLHGSSVTGLMNKKVFINSLAWDGDISSMDGIVPVVVSNYANEAYAVGFNISLWPVELTIPPQQFTLQGLENQTVTYRIIFPRGVSANATDTLGKSIVSGKTTDGRDYIELAFDGGAAGQSTTVTCMLSASPVYVLGIFLPCILVFILLIILVVIIFLIRKKRGGLRTGKRKIFEPEDNEPEQYGGQEYYVPPPPPTTKRKK